MYIASQRLKPEQKKKSKFQPVDGELPVTECRKKAKILFMT